MYHHPSVHQRLHLVRSNSDLVALSVAKALAAGAGPDLVVLLMGTSDPLARSLSAAILEKSSDLDLDAEEARVLRRDEIPTGLAVVPVRLAELLFAATHPGVLEALRVEPPFGRVRVIVMAAGGATLMHLMVRAVGTVGRA